MHFAFPLTIFSLALLTAGSPLQPRQVNPSTINSLLPSFGVVPNTNPTGGNCEGMKADGSPVHIPCNCPPNRDEFIAKLSSAVAAGRVLNNPIKFSADVNDQSVATLKSRATAALIMLQNFSGRAGVGCPAVSAPNFLKMQTDGVFHITVLVG
ncbi:hypothetical protein DL546_005728 [Coniochaeta pulveracea]|uniref:Uncharacterized protein n=1 Tax=Coniochaeta pulveracea TaxID=177199 RepID=A0A420Y5W4_9PEZI|nr:hypothetical protein DL546_005728 [Coniochaeta pulveracea]